MTDPHLTRRAFIGTALAAATVAACSSSDEVATEPAPSAAASTTVDPEPSATAEPVAADPTAEPVATAAPAATTEAEASGVAPTPEATATTEAPAAEAPVTSPVAERALAPSDFAALGTCVLLPESTAGPYPLDEQFNRRDISEGYPGHPVRLGLRVLDATCAPIPGAAVEVWHCDATGDYSAFTDNGGGKDEGSGTTFLRGTQRADDDGIVEFDTVYPGWYRGRAVHIHLRVHVDDTTVLTSQMYFDGEYTAAVYADAPYAEFGLPDTSNEADRIAGNVAANGTLLHLTPSATRLGAGTLALLNLGLDPTTESTGGGGPGGPGGGRDRGDRP